MYLVEIQNIIIPSKSAILHHKHQNTRMRRQIAPMLSRVRCMFGLNLQLHVTEKPKKANVMAAQIIRESKLCVLVMPSNILKSCKWWIVIGRRTLMLSPWERLITLNTSCKRNILCKFNWKPCRIW